MAVFAPLALVACGGGQVVVTAEIDVEDPETGERVTRPIADTEIRAIPYNRDAIFDSLAAAYPEPEPVIPDSVLQAQAQVQEAQEEWRNAEAAWGASRERLQEINDELEGLNPAEGRYRVLFMDFQDFEDRMVAAERTMNSAFEEFTSLQQASLAAAEEARLARELWEDVAFENFGLVAEQHERASGRATLADTTGADGVVTFQNLKPGTWWITSRYELPFTELYWNIQVEVETGDPIEIRLNRSNAEIRPKL
ncbi:MAG: hypothetical protein WEA09_03050 [Gemmatimonadota bacterium]